MPDQVYAKRQLQHEPDEQQLLPDVEPPFFVETDIPPDMILRTGSPLSGCAVNGSSIILCWNSKRVDFWYESLGIVS